MGVIRFNRIKPGMVLAGDVMDRMGRVILRAGLKLTELHLKTLKAWGITETDIQGEENEKVEEKTEIPAAVEAQLKEAFRHTDQTHPAMKELFRLSVLYQLKQTGKGR